MHDASELRNMIAEHPELPVVVLMDGEACPDEYRWWYANSVKCSIGVILDCELDWSDKTYTDEDEFEEDLEEEVSEEIGRYFPGHEDDWEPSDDEFESKVKEELQKYEPYWTKVIEVWCGN